MASSHPPTPNDYFRVSVRLFDNPKLADLADEFGTLEVYALWVYILATAKTAKHLGRITISPMRTARMLGITPPSKAQQMLDGLVEKRCLIAVDGEPDLYEIRNWERWQSMTNAERVRKYRMKRLSDTMHTESVTDDTESVTGNIQTRRDETIRDDTTKQFAPAPEREARVANIVAVFEHWRELEESTVGELPDGTRVDGIRKPKLTDGRRKHINARLEDGYTVADLCNAISAFLADPWHLGDNDRATRYTDITTILKNAPKVDAGLVKYRAAAAARNGNGKTSYTKPQVVLR